MPSAHSLFTLSKPVIALNNQISIEILTTSKIIVLYIHMEFSTYSDLSQYFKFFQFSIFFCLRNPRNGRMEIPGKDQT